MNYCLYEQSLFRQAAGAEFRPGGLGLTEELAAECRLEPGGRVLDLGCGVGSTASYLARSWGVTAVGLDCSARFTAEAETRDPSVVWVTSPAGEIPYPDGSFDAVFAECFLSTLDRPAEVLREVRRVLRPGGRLAVSDMYLRNPEAAPSTSRLPAATCLRGAAGKEATVARLEAAGFAVRVWRDRSETLKTLFASLIMAYGSAASFWKAAADGRAVCPDWLSVARPGFYLLIAEPHDV